MRVTCNSLRLFNARCQIVLLRSVGLRAAEDGAGRVALSNNFYVCLPHIHFSNDLKGQLFLEGTASVVRMSDATRAFGEHRELVWREAVLK